MLKKRMSKEERKRIREIEHDRAYIEKHGREHPKTVRFVARSTISQRKDFFNHAWPGYSNEAITRILRDEGKKQGVKVKTKLHKGKQAEKARKGGLVSSFSLKYENGKKPRKK